MTSGRAKVVPIAIIIPLIPKRLPWRAVSGELKPLSANMKQTLETKYKNAEISSVILKLVLSVSF
jgi:hypothetical protein